MTAPHRTSLHALARAVEAFLTAPKRQEPARRRDLISAFLRLGPLDDLEPPPPKSAEGSAVLVDYAILFCEQIADLTPDEEAWIVANLRPTDEWESFVERHGTGVGPAFSALHVHYAAGDAFPEFDWRLEDDPVHGRRLRVWSESFGNADHVAAVAEAFLTRFRPAEVFTLSWVETCSAPRPGAFSGGAIVVTAAGREYLTLGEWLEARRETTAAASPPACTARVA